MAQSVHHCPLCQGEISQRKSELLRSVVSQMQAIDAEQSASKEIANTQFSPEPESPLQVKVEPDEEEKLPGPSIPTPRVNHVKNHPREMPDEEEKEQYFCPAPGCPNVYKKLGTHLIKHALGKHGIKINPKNFSRGRKRNHLALEGERLSQIRKKFRPANEDRQNNSVILHPTLANRSFPWENKPNRIVNEQEIITQSLTKEDGTTEVQYKCPWTNCKSVYRRIGQSLIRHAFEKHGIIIQAASPEGLYSCPAVGCRSFYRKYGASLFHHALEKHGIVLEDWLTKQGRPRKTSTLNDKTVKRKKEQELAAKMIAQAQQSPTSSNHSNHFSRAKERNCPPWACGSCGLVFQNRSNMLEHVLYAHGRPPNPTIQLPPNPTIQLPPNPTIQLPALEAVPCTAKNSNSESSGLLPKDAEQELLQLREIKNERLAGELMSNGPKIPPFEQEEKHDPIHIEQSETESDSHPGNKGSSEEPNPSSAVQIRNLKQTPEVLDLKERPNSSFISKQNPQYFLLKDSFLQNVDDRS